MSRVLDILRAIILPLGWICALLALVTPVWFLVAAFGTKWEFLSLEFGLGWMTREMGQKLLLACIIAGVLGAIFMLLHRLLAKEVFGVVSSPILVLAIGLAGLGWTWSIDQARAATRPLLDITTDPADPPNFSTSLVARRGANAESLDYAAKQDEAGRPLAEVQAELYPDLTTLQLDRSPDVVFDAAMTYAHENNWRVGSASRSAGMFEAGAESFWFGLRDDIVVRIREDGQGGSLVDIRTLARRPVHDLGRNPARAADFLAAMAGED
ncbi:DUF1499 domain-containing protein [Maricaulis parjimensis]|uniref:DUF1499 domain-containing protein n=1 Tax=Maricaulis parjimensis TaxID=144023 RepID=UPI00193A6592|nr:DUF1499 domain-containing protein [Maricaulis parjimensis]